MFRQVRHPVALWLLWAGVGGLLRADDALQRLGSGTVHRGKVVGESATEVTFQERSGTTIRVPVDEIESIEYDSPAGAALRQGEFAENAGRWPEALKLYEEVLKKATPDSFPYVAAQFAKARCLAKEALLHPEKAAEAARALEATLEAYPATRHYFPTLELLGRIYLVAKNHPKAAEVFEKLRQAPLGRYQTAATLYRAQLQLLEGNVEEASRLVESLLSQPELHPWVRWRALLLKAQILAARKSFDEAEQTARKVVDEVPAEDAENNPAAFLVLGRIYEQGGKPMDAVLAYLYVELLYPSAKLHRVEALTALERLWKQLGRPDRAEAARAKLQEELSVQAPPAPEAPGSEGSETEKP
jgi:tetratricopeptide (TPR) repeat protein